MGGAGRVDTSGEGHRHRVGFVGGQAWPAHLLHLVCFVETLGYRSDHGARASMILIGILTAARKQGESYFAALCSVPGPAPLRLPAWLAEHIQRGG